MHQPSNSSAWRSIRHMFSVLIYFFIRLIFSLEERIQQSRRRFTTLIKRTKTKTTISSSSSSIPPHVALSCPFLAERRDSIAILVLHLFDVGVSHVTLFDPAQPIQVNHFLRVLGANNSNDSTTIDENNSTDDDDYDDSNDSNDSNDSDEYEKQKGFNVSVKHITVNYTNRAHVTIPMTLPSPPNSENHHHRHRKNTIVENNCNSNNSQTSTSSIKFTKVSHSQFHPCITTTTTTTTTTTATTTTQSSSTSTTHSLSPSLSQNHRHHNHSHLTFVDPHAGHAGIVRSAQFLASSSLSSVPSINAISTWLDSDPLSVNLPSEPDVLVVFPVQNAPSLPVLHGFPPWQLRLTQLVFCEDMPQHVSKAQLKRLVSNAACAPKRFGR